MAPLTIVKIVLIVLVIFVLIRAWRKPTQNADKTKSLFSLESFVPKSKSFFFEAPEKSDPSRERKFKSEELCRDIFEEHFEQKFEKTRPEWLRNPETGRKLELDGYCEKLKIAFEYNGEQHYVFPNAFHKTEKEFKKQVFRDRVKKKLCKKNGVKLISIPYTVKTDKLKSYIEKKLS